MDVEAITQISKDKVKILKDGRAIQDEVADFRREKLKVLKDEQEIQEALSNESLTVEQREAMEKYRELMRGIGGNLMYCLVKAMNLYGADGDLKLTLRAEEAK